MRVAIVHHWFVTHGGGERVAECIASLFPDAEIFSLMAVPSEVPMGIRQRVLHLSFLQKMPLARTHHRHMLPLYPWATEGLDLRGFDVVISSDSGPVKGVRVDPGAVHICYCHSPMRYLWDSYDAYRSEMGWLTRLLFTWAAPRVRHWDVRAAERVSYFVANSYYVAERIRRFYGREARVIYPPIDLDRAASTRGIVPGEHYLAAGRLVGYKRVRLAIEACNRLGRTLRVVGVGPEEAELRRMAGPGVTFLGELDTDALWREYSACRALLFAADEDFGMVPLEAQACGRPVIAYGAGGSLETVRGARTVAWETEDGFPTGVYFGEQTVDSMVEGMLRFEAMEARGAFDPEMTRRWAENFSTPLFLRGFQEFVRERVAGVGDAMAGAVAPEYVAEHA